MKKKLINNSNTMTNLIKILERVTIPAPKSKQVYGRILLKEYQRTVKAKNKIRERDILYLAMIHDVPQFQEMLDASDYNLQQIQRRIEHHITNQNSYWQMDGKRYAQMNDYEKAYFNEFLNQIKS